MGKTGHVPDRRALEQGSGRSRPQEMEARSAALALITALHFLPSRVWPHAMNDEKIDIKLTINGCDHVIRLEPRCTLVDAIRDESIRQVR
jgi:hypothetical protein